jgi:hypothetical protein
VFLDSATSTRICEEEGAVEGCVATGLESIFRTSDRDGIEGMAGFMNGVINSSGE